MRKVKPIIANPCTFYPEWLVNPPFHLRSKLKDGEPCGPALVCQCGSGCHGEVAL